MGWADDVRTLKVRTNADTPRDTKQAVKFGAEGIGLCRTEHMFFEATRIAAVREMILADTEEQREKALAKILPMQQGDFEAMYKALEGRPDDRPLSWIRRCMSSCPIWTWKRTSPSWPTNWAVPWKKSRHKIDRSARVQPHDGSPRLPSGRHLSRNCRDADPCGYAGCHQRAARNAAMTSCPRS